MLIEGKTALVTGAAGALGNAMVQTLIEGGAKAVIGLDLQQIEGDKIISATCDLSDAAAVEATLTPLLAEHTVDILINNAGILHSAPLVNMVSKDTERFANAAADWERTINVNLSSAFYVTQLVADQMAKKRTKGVIVNMSSVSSGGNAGQSAYSASKAGIESLTKVWAKELSPMGIRSVAIAPGYINTPSTHKAVSESQLAAITDKIPLKRLGEAENILQAMRFVIENDYVNATTIEVDGGFKP
ncbi:MAG: SDR family NAD(P)-dependent oxidoreductase [Rickettsiales bacterium]